ncbi:MAG: PIN domain-containing protein [Candidatus Eisenbacteria sp.]|nr:PIN domain-containing protein [Candidatus Eisenbacteria bacterium]
MRSDAECWPTARKLDQNDMWIAATAASLGAHLLTTDSDFDHLAGEFIHLVRVDSRTGASSHRQLCSTGASSMRMSSWAGGGGDDGELATPGQGMPLRRADN